MTYPTNPTAGDTHILSGKTWKYDGTNWSKLGLSRTLSAPVAFSDLTNTPTTLSGYGITDGATGTSESVPVGTVIYYSANTPPTNFIKANGDAVSRTTYSDLFTVIGTTYGAGDGSTTFNVPDLRGEFMRGWDDSRGIDNSRVFGSSQVDAIKDHEHRVFRASVHGSSNIHYSNLYRGYGYNDFGTSSVANSGRSGPLYSGGGYSETRPRNIALLACIKY
jgi:phage-related tail fiber protein